MGNRRKIARRKRESLYSKVPWAVSFWVAERDTAALTSPQCLDLCHRRRGLLVVLICGS